MRGRRAKGASGWIKGCRKRIDSSTKTSGSSARICFLPAAYVHVRDSDWLSILEYETNLLSSIHLALRAASYSSVKVHKGLWL